MADADRSSGGATSPPRSSPRTAAGRARSSSTRASRSPSTRPPNRAGMREYNDYIAEWRKTQRALRRRPRGRGRRPRPSASRPTTRKHRPRGADPDRRRRRRTGPAARHDIGRVAAVMTDTVVSSATREVVIGFDRPFVIIGERINPTGRKLLAEEMKAGDFSRVERDVARPGRGRRPHARHQRRHPAGRRAGDPGPDDPARPEPDRPAAVDRLVDRRGARGRARGLPGQAAASTR